MPAIGIVSPLRWSVPAKAPQALVCEVLWEWIHLPQALDTYKGGTAMGVFGHYDVEV